MKPGTEVDVYWNLHRKQFSVRSRKTRRVIGHADLVVLADVQFVVGQKARQRAVRTGQRNVHAYARGVLCSPDRGSISYPNEVHYNPFRAKHFTDRWGRHVIRSRLAVLEDGKIFTP